MLSKWWKVGFCPCLPIKLDINKPFYFFWLLNRHSPTVSHSFPAFYDGEHSVFDCFYTRDTWKTAEITFQMVESEFCHFPNGGKRVFVQVYPPNLIPTTLFIPFGS
jgi:hypothetical protein